jgi:hypothetical protein
MRNIKGTRMALVPESEWLDRNLKPPRLHFRNLWESCVVVDRRWAKRQARRGRLAGSAGGSHANNNG